MFQQIQNTLGQNKPGTTYPLKTLVRAFITDVKDVEFSQKTGKPGQSLYLRAENGEIAWVKLTGKFDPLTAVDKGTCRDFLVWPFKPQDSPKTYLYCWIQRQAPQQPQTQPQATKLPQGGTETDLIQLVNRIAIALEKIADNNQSFEQKYNLEENDTPLF